MQLFYAQYYYFTSVCNKHTHSIRRKFGISALFLSQSPLLLAHYKSNGSHAKIISYKTIICIMLKMFVEWKGGPINLCATLLPFCNKMLEKDFCGRFLRIIIPKGERPSQTICSWILFGDIILIHRALACCQHTNCATVLLCKRERICIGTHDAISPTI